MEYNQTEEALIAQIQSFENPEIVGRFLDLARELLIYCNLQDGKEPLVCSIVKADAKLTIYIGNRRVFYLKKDKNKFMIGLLLPEDTSLLSVLVGYIDYEEFVKDEKDDYKKIIANFDFDKFIIDKDFKQKWLDSAKQELNRFNVSPRRTALHNESFFKSIVDLDYRKEVLTNININYWIFQGNPKYYRITDALSDGNLKHWIINAHKDKIRKGDKVIVWITGDKAGCYALLSITSDVYVGKSDEVELQYYPSISEEDEKESEIVALETDYNLCNNPILKEDIRKIPGLQNLKVGRQGTNFSATREEYHAILNLIENQTNPIIQNPMKHPLNLLLYGPPGTGKTYSVKKRAIQIIEPDFEGDINEKFNALKEAGQIEFVTFHQAFAYEEFIEGLSAKTENGQISYEIKDGIFKRMANEAKANFLKAIVKNENAYLDFNEIFEDFIAPLYENDEVKIKIDMQKGHFFITKVEDDIIHFDKQGGTSLHTLSRKILQSIYENKREYRKDGLGVYYYPLVNRLKSIASAKPKIEEKLKNYVLIIDEINRANISKVFGELITLIEDSKRLGANDAHTVTLPYSQDEFGVPQNLYLIGTMNTADRSIAMLDIALRRRFEFEEMMPQTEKIKENANLKYYEDLLEQGVDLIQLLFKINQRIEFFLDRDHTIGHAYFFGINTLESLAKVFLNKIIPLLQEYFYDNWEKICLVLSNAQGTCDLIEKTDLKSIDLFKSKNSDLYLLDKKISYKVKQIGELDKAEIYTGIYEA